MDTETLKQNQSNKSVQKIATLIILLVFIIAAGFLPAIKTPIIRLGFGFIPVMLGGMLIETPYLVGLAVVGDILKYFLINSAQGTFNPGITLGSALAALIWGIAFKGVRKVDWEFNKKFIIKAVIASVLVVVFANLLVNTFAISIQLGKGFLALLFPWRLYSEIITLFLHIPFAIALGFAVSKFKKSSQVYAS